LIAKLKKYGLKGNALEFVLSYLQDRLTTTRINNKQSPFINIKTGVPQGSSLSALLFNIFMSDICGLDFKSLIIMYADDIVLITIGDTIQKVIDNITHDLSLLNQWLVANGMMLNTGKTKYMSFSPTNLSNNYDISNELIIHSQTCKRSSCDCSTVQQVTYFKYLGVIIDKNLRWKRQVATIIKRLIPFLAIAYKLRYFINNRLARLIFHGLIKPTYSYGIELWGSTFESTLNPLKNIVNKISSIFGLYPNKKDIFSLTSIDHLYIFKTCLILKKLQPPANSTIYNLRRTRLQVIRPNLELIKRQFIFSGYKTFSSIMHLLDINESKIKFKKKLKDLLSQNPSLSLKNILQINGCWKFHP
jgi:hypothetical protein